MTELKRGFIMIKKSQLKGWCNDLRMDLRSLDAVMKEPESYQRGKKIASIVNRIDITRQRIELYGLGLKISQIGIEGRIK